MTGIKLAFLSVLFCITDFRRQAESRINGYTPLCNPKIQSPHYIITVTQIELQPLHKLSFFPQG